jgi:DNA-directed RNA polymerase
MSVAQFRTAAHCRYLNHLGSDASRGCLLFAESRALGDHGLYWLKVHMANKWGNSVDKLPFEERARFTESILDDIVDSAQNPIHGRGRWRQAEDPFQFLAAAIDLTHALASPDARRYHSHVPVHMDGSCNGLQHYAALARDLHGGTAVNLVPAERPQDVYTGIAELVRKRVEQDAAGGAEIEQDVRPSPSPNPLLVPTPPSPQVGRWINYGAVQANQLLSITLVGVTGGVRARTATARGP